MYTSGSTGKPKGIVHSTGGYLLSTLLTTKYAFDFQSNIVFFCTADMGWLAAGSHSLYGPMCLGGTTIVFGGVFSFPSYFRLFDIIQKYNVTHLYTAPTVIRMMRRYFNERHDDPCYNLKSIKNKYPMKTLRVLGSVGEPLNSEAYKWYSKYFNNLSVVDTYWQTESGSIMICPIISKEIKNESVGLPFYGMQPVIVKELKENKDECILIDRHGVKYAECRANETGTLIFKGQWPSVARNILKDKESYAECYWNTFKGYYTTGDEAVKDQDGYFYVLGRFDDVLNVSGHRLSTAQIESAVCGVEGVAEAAVVPEDDEITGQAVVIYVVLLHDLEDSKDELAKTIKSRLRSKIGPIVNPKRILFVDDLPKTRTGKIMRRILKGVLNNKDYGDINSCSNVEIIENLKND